MRRHFFACTAEIFNRSPWNFTYNTCHGDEHTDIQYSREIQKTFESASKSLHNIKVTAIFDALY